LDPPFYMTHSKLNRRKTMKNNNELRSHSESFTDQSTPGGGRMVKRRGLATFLMTAVFICALALIASSTLTVRGEAATAPQLEGAWRVTSTIAGGPPPFSALYNFSGGGTLQETDEIQLLPPSAGPGLGTWTKVGSNQYAFTWESYLFDIGNNMPAGRLKVRGMITMSDRNTYTAVDQFTFYDAAGNVTAEGCATEAATRMTIEPVTACPGLSKGEMETNNKLRLTSSWKN
jgi:hypothetical protein